MIVQVGRLLSSLLHDHSSYINSQGMAFFSKYRELRRHAHLEEVNYNMGRAFHQLCKHHACLLSSTLTTAISAVF